ncbi:hypothetical protein [Telluria beijingensis]|uniref:hypothetical protein n=1 Tax=Telluria beijingensis TaxID=3068633 RepID=UPI00279590B3|nr:hypothetical protein [Massilia sp. REN29]
MPLDAVIATKLAEILMVDTSVDITGAGAEERREYTYQTYQFKFNRGHAYRDHNTGPATNPRYAGPDKAIERAIMDDAIVRIVANAIPPVAAISLPGTGVRVHGTPIRYNLVRVVSNTSANGFAYIVSDYMVWQGNPGVLT